MAIPEGLMDSAGFHAAGRRFEAKLTSADSFLCVRWTVQVWSLLRADRVQHAATLEGIFENNDVQLFDLHTDPDEVHNFALAPEKNRETILRMNGLLNDLIAKEVGVNDGAFSNRSSKEARYRQDEPSPVGMRSSEQRPRWDFQVTHCRLKRRGRCRSRSSSLAKSEI